MTAQRQPLLTEGLRRAMSSVLCNSPAAVRSTLRQSRDNSFRCEVAIEAVVTGTRRSSPPPPKENLNQSGYLVEQVTLAIVLAGFQQYDHG
jgi:hypothetical protein